MPAAAQATGLPSRLGKYELLLPLAAGGMARIYIGRSTGIGQFERHVVLKMITPERANDLTAVNMFLDEARLAASLNHQNVAQVFEVGEENSIHYLAMEYVHGQDLRAVLAKAGSQGTRIPLELALTVVAGAAAGLNHAHERRGPDGTPLGIVHRDVSPSNIMIGYDGAVKLLDFGIAKATMRSVETQSGIIKGKFAYMAPEQCRGRDVDRRSDVFSLGIILYEISTQHRCFRADSDFDTMHRIVTGDVVRPTRLVQGYPQALEAIVMKALAVDATQRYQSAGLLLEALEAFAVSARMSLSTMGLGRFMRDMFGEVQEPWLNKSMKMAAAPVVTKENTISSTDGSRSGMPRSQQQTTPTELVSDGAPDEEGRFEPSQGNEAAQTLVQMPNSQDIDMNDDPAPGWNPKSYPSSQPSMASNETLPPDAHAGGPPYGNRAASGGPSGTHRVPGSMPITSVPTTMPGTAPAPTRPTPPPQAVAFGTQPMPMGQGVPQGQFPAQHTPGSGSSPALGALNTPNQGLAAPGVIASTKHGYASGSPTRNDASYPLYEPPADLAPAADVQLKPNRRPLFIGLGVVVVGVIVMLVVTLGGSKNDGTTTTADDELSGSNEGTAPGSDTPDEMTVTPSNGSATEPDDSRVSVVVESEPPGADVMIAGAKIGVTPFNDRVKRGSKIVQLTVRKDGYVDFTGRIDLGGEYENKNIKLVKVEDAKGSATPSTGDGRKDTPDGAGPGSAKPSGGGAGSGSAVKPSGGGGPKPGGGGGGTGGGSAKKDPPKPKCQPPGPNVDPFGLPVCKT